MMNNEELKLIVKLAEYNLMSAAVLFEISSLNGKEEYLLPEINEPWVSSLQFVENTDACSAPALYKMFNEDENLPGNIWKKEGRHGFVKQEALINYLLTCKSPTFRNRAKKYLKRKEKLCKTTSSHTLPPQPID